MSWISEWNLIRYAIEIGSLSVRANEGGIVLLTIITDSEQIVFGDFVIETTIAEQDAKKIFVIDHQDNLDLAEFLLQEVITSYFPQPLKSKRYCLASINIELNFIFGL